MKKINIIISTLTLLAILFETIRGNEPWLLHDQAKINITIKYKPKKIVDPLKKTNYKNSFGNDSLFFLNN
jgi:hypothetical protein